MQPNLSLKHTIAILGFALTSVFTGCVTTKHEVSTQHEIKPIEITLNVNLKINRELDDFFGDLDSESELKEFTEEDTAI